MSKWLNGLKYGETLTHSMRKRNIEFITRVLASEKWQLEFLEKVHTDFLSGFLDYINHFDKNHNLILEAMNEEPSG